MKKLTKNDYTIFNGHKFFYTPNDKGLQCAHCLNIQDRTFVKNKNGLIIGIDLLPENESHSYDCKQNDEQNTH